MTRGRALGYLAVLGASFVAAMVAGWLGTPIDDDAYDWMFVRHTPAAAPAESILLVADEESLNHLGGIAGLRRALAEGLERIAQAGPKAVAVDLMLADPGDPAQDAALEAAFAKTPELALACAMADGGRRWEEPRELFRRRAAAVGHVHAEPEGGGVCRKAPLEKVVGRDRRWALALEAFRLSRGVQQIVESPRELRVGAAVIPAAWANSRTLRVRYRTAPLERVSLWALHANPALAQRFRGKVVFAGVIAESAARDRYITPLSDSQAQVMAGLEIHANLFETLAQGRFLTSAPDLSIALACLALALMGTSAFAFRTGWQAYSLAALALAAAHLGPYWLFTYDIVFPYFAPVSAAWLSVVGAGAFQFVTVRRDLRRAETEKTRYQQAMHFVTHEMRTPLTAIQGSSELMTRYNLSEEKRQQMAGLITSESKRLAKMIETFLNVERLTEGQIALKKDEFAARDLVEACLDRARPLAERKQIRIEVENTADATLTGDRELMEYAVYNLLNNAVKYSPSGTVVTVSGRAEPGRLLLAVRDQGIGMDRQDLKKIFRKFYRTHGAVESGEAGTGIGLSIVEQIVTHHGGRIEVTSAPGQGSCFTLVLPRT